MTLKTLGLTDDLITVIEDLIFNKAVVKVDTDSEWAELIDGAYVDNAQELAKLIVAKMAQPEDTPVPTKEKLVSQTPSGTTTGPKVTVKMSKLDKDSILTLLKTNDQAVGRALVALNKRQNTDEQIDAQTKYRNGRGFRPCHARMGTSMAKFYERRAFLSPKQVAYWRKTMKDGNMRIGIYAGQLLEIAQEKQGVK